MSNNLLRSVFFFNLTKECQVFQFLLKTVLLPLALLMMVVESYSLMVTQANSVDLNPFSRFIDYSPQLFSVLQCQRIESALQHSVILCFWRNTDGGKPFVSIFASI